MEIFRDYALYYNLFYQDKTGLSLKTPGPYHISNKNTPSLSNALRAVQKDANT